MRTIFFENEVVKLIDQTLLPEKLEYIECRDWKCLEDCIKRLAIRGAPAIGACGAYALALEIQKAKTKKEFFKNLFKASQIEDARPTAHNLKWAVDRVLQRVEKNKDLELETLKKLVLAEAEKIADEDVEINKRIGQNGANLIKDGDTILTHCNAGAFATVSYGTALGVVRAAWKRGKKIRVFADETRPLLQGARITTFELLREKIPVTLITDNTAGYVMKKGLIDVVIVGADRIARNGDTANKIGTYSLAVLAKEHEIPFYIAAPISTIDLKTKNGEEIPIEMRDAREITHIKGMRIAPEVDVLNFAFDVTPAEYITGIITEKGILRKPYEERIKELFN
ncbi:MAG: S-methyl-5-thioribose-1-phosphate isomerase [Candidatus Methanofastidiosia archaeon]